MFVGHHKLHGAVASAVGGFNEGAVHLTRVMDLLAIEANEVTQAIVENRDRLRVMKAERAWVVSAKATRKRKGEDRKRKCAHEEEEEGPSYVAGGFA